MCNSQRYGDIVDWGTIIAKMHDGTAAYDLKLTYSLTPPPPKKNSEV